MKSSNISLIISREYLTRVRKKSFIIITILLPILMAALIVLPVLLVLKSEEGHHSNVLVVDETSIFLNNFKETDNITYNYCSGDITTLKQEIFNDDKYDCIFHILNNSDGLKSNLYYKSDLPSNLQSTLESQVDEIFFNQLLQDSLNITPERFEKLQELTKVRVTTIQVDESGNEHQNIAEVNQLFGMFCGLLIYFVILMFAGQVLRGVLEEKSSRIVEVLISSVKPIELLTGKIVGIALVSLTQLLIWLVLTFGIVTVVGITTAGDSGMETLTEISSAANTEQLMTADTPDLDQLDVSLFQEINQYFTVSFTEIILSFLFFFVVGYLIYSTLFAATGSVVDNESDSQQYTLPITMPLIMSIALVPSISTNPSGQLALWCSMIPLTSPIAMMVRLPAGVPLWQLLTSMAIALLFLAFCVWFAARIYRIGILSYGKKPSWRDIFRWLRQS